jgi:cytochrome P450
MRKAVHGYFTPKSLETWRPFVQRAVKHLLDAVEDKGRMDVMRIWPPRWRFWQS